MIAARNALMEGVSTMDIRYGQLLTLAVAIPSGIVLKLLLLLI